MFIYTRQIWLSADPQLILRNCPGFRHGEHHVGVVLYFYRSTSLVFGFRNSDYVKIKMAAQRKVFVVGVGMTKVSV